MTEVVINRQYGGLELSNKAIELWAKYSNIDLTPQYYSYTIDNPEIYYYLYEDDNGSTNILYPNEYIHRDDPNLIRVVKELGDEANTEVSELVVVDIPDDVEWTIVRYSYDMEIVVEKGKVWF